MDNRLQLEIALAGLIAKGLVEEVEGGVKLATSLPVKDSGKKVSSFPKLNKRIKK